MPLYVGTRYALLAAGATAAGGVAPPGGTDPHFANVVFLSDFEFADGTTSFQEQSSAARTVTGGSGAEIDNAQAEYGSTSLKSPNTINCAVPDSADWDLSAANSDRFTFEYSYYQTDVASTYDVWSTNFAGGNRGLLLRHGGADYNLFWWHDGSSAQVLTATGAFTGLANQWVKWCIEKNSSGKFRIYRNGSMLTSVTPANSVIFATTGNPLINASGAGQTGWLDNMRITKGVDRYNNDAGYTPATGPFPTS
jgi:hypothetical protein